MAKLTVYFFANGNLEEQANYYMEVFGDGKLEGIMKYEKNPAYEADEKLIGKVMHMAFSAGGVTFMGSDQLEKVEEGGAISLLMDFDDRYRAKDVFDKLAKDGLVIMPFDKTFWESEYGMVKDKWGRIWQIQSYIKS